MKEGQISHDEVNAAIAKAEKTVIFGRQNRLRDGMLIEGDEVLQRFHAGHDKVKFFYSAVRQLPEYFLDALLAKDITVTLILGQGLLCFKDARNHQAIHLGRTRRTIYIPELILDVAVRNGYDYWSITQILIIEGWKLLDFILLCEMIEEGKRFMMERSVAILGYSAVRRLLREKNKHRSSYESRELLKKKEELGLDVAVSEVDEFLREYEPRLLRAMRFGGDGRLGAALEKSFREMEPDAIAKALYNEYREEVWAARKAEELCEEMNFPDFFLLDRDIVHPAAREMAEVAGQDAAPQNMDEARHDYRDVERFGYAVQLGRERFIQQAVQFAPEGIKGLIEEISIPLLKEGKLDETLLDWARNILGDMASKSKNFYLALEPVIDLFRFRETMRFFVDVEEGRRQMQVENFEPMRVLLIGLVSMKAGRDMTRLQLINSLKTAEALLEQLKVVLYSMAKDVVGKEKVPPLYEEGVDWNKVFGEILGELEAQIEMGLVNATLCLDLAPDYQRIVRQLADRGQKTRAWMRQFLEAVAGDPEQQMVAVNVRRALEGHGEGGEALGEVHEDSEILGNLVERVDAVIDLLPERMHTCTAGSLTSLRKAMKEFEEIKRRFPTDPQQLGPLAMVLIRLDRADHYAALLEQILWMGKYAIGERKEVKEIGPAGRTFTRVFYSPGLLKIMDEDVGGIWDKAEELVREMQGEEVSVVR